MIRAVIEITTLQPDSPPCRPLNFSATSCQTPLSEEFSCFAHPPSNFHPQIDGLV